jgi:glucose/arabinose dehydrogenase
MRGARAIILFCALGALGACHDDQVQLSPTPSLTLVASGLLTALYVTAPPADSARIFVVQQSGVIRVLRHDTLLTTPFLDLSSVISYGGERGLLSMAFEPNYATSGRFYVDYTDLNGSLTVTRFHVSADPNVADRTSGVVILSIPHAMYDNHNGGLVLFGPDGYLYVGAGDGGSGGDPNGHGQDTTQLLGKILRLDVSGPGPYAIPPSNPFAGHAGAARQEIWAYGLRNPWRFSFDRTSHDFYIGDVGQDSVEEVDFAPAGDPGGHNYGWNIMEGSRCYPPSVTVCATGGLVLPVEEFNHSNGNCSVIGGYVYRGASYPNLVGRYFYGDLCGGWVASLKMQGGVATDVRDHSKDFGLLPNLTSFGEDASGELYVTVQTGQVYRIAPK